MSATASLSSCLGSMNSLNLHCRKGSSQGTCIKCAKGGDLLVCGNGECSIEVHKSCMPCPVQFDDIGNFYCPYCLCKQSFAEWEQAKNDVLLAHKAISAFLNGNTEPKSEHKPIAKYLSIVLRRDVSTSSCKDDGKLNQHDEITVNQMHLKSLTSESLCYKEQEKTLGDESLVYRNDKAEISKAQISPNVEVRERNQLEHCTRHDCPQIEKDDRYQQWADPSDYFSLEEATADAALNGLAKKDQEIANTAEGPPCESRDKEHTQAESVESTVYSVRKVRAAGICEKPNTRDESSASCPGDYIMRYLTRGRRGTQSMVMSKNVIQPGKLSVDKHEAHEAVSSHGKGQFPKLTKRVQSPLVLNARHRKLPWTAEEEEMLREGVRKFSSTIKKNMPWTKILELGSLVFDRTRTPADLKDKRRNVSKESAESPNSQTL
ncbi:hypothetical protein Ancab_008223 [Ancistrocladus abbreviatus]